MSRHGRSDHAQYFGYQPAARHAEGCSRRETNVWEVTRFLDYGIRGHDEEPTATVLRYACRECGSVAFETFDGPRSGFEQTSSAVVGYGSRPERLGRLWLHPGEQIDCYDKRGPWHFYVTLTRDRPERPADVAGIVGWNLGPRGGITWSAGTGCTDYGSIETSAGRQFASRRAAVGWISAALAAAEQR